MDFSIANLILIKIKKGVYFNMEDIIKIKLDVDTDISSTTYEKYEDILDANSVDWSEGSSYEWAREWIAQVTPKQLKKLKNKLPVKRVKITIINNAFARGLF